MSEPAKTYSLMLRVRSVTYQDAYVSVPITEAILTKREDGTLGINLDAFTAEAIRISHDPQVEWQVESSHIEPHPTQNPKPEDRQSFDAFYTQSEV